MRERCKTKDWIQNAEEEREGKKQQNIEKYSTLTKRKAPGPDGAHGCGSRSLRQCRKE